MRSRGQRVSRGCQHDGTEEGSHREVPIVKISQQQREKNARSARAKSARAKQILNQLIYDLLNREGSLLITMEAAAIPNFSLDFLGLRFLQAVVESGTFREKVRQALRQCREQLVAREELR